MAPAIVGVEDARAMHDIAHPEFVGRVEGEAAAVLRGRLLRGAGHESLAAEQPMHGGRREHDLGGNQLVLARGRDQHRHAESGVRLFEDTELVSHGGRQGARVPGVTPRARLERVEAAAAIGVEPIAQRLGGDAAARAAGDLVLAIGFLAQLRVQRPVARRQMQQIGDQAVAKQRDGLVVGWGRDRQQQLMLTAIRHRSSLPAIGGQAGSSAGRRPGVSPHPVLAGRARRARRAGWGTNPSGRGRAGSNAGARAQGDQRVVGVQRGADRAEVGGPAKRSGSRVTTASSVARTSVNRRRTHRTADGSTMSGRRTSAAASILRAASTCATTRSRSSRSPGNRLARPSGRQAEGFVGRGTVVPRDPHPRRRLPRVGAMARKPAAARGCRGHCSEPCLLPGTFGNIGLAGQRAWIAQLHRPGGARLPPWRSHPPFPVALVRTAGRFLLQLAPGRRVTPGAQV